LVNRLLNNLAEAFKAFCIAGFQNLKLTVANLIKLFSGELEFKKLGNCYNFLKKNSIKAII